ncbi:MAG: DUF58 domain-containing protein [Dehalococcoidales bacterium]|nr:DUF58 domain-containing protein [Dehalococcoidales bacterium]
MLGKLWLIITFLLVFISLATHQVVLFMVALLFFLTGATARIWATNALKRITYERKLSAERVGFGETIDLQIEIANRKPLPLPWVQTDDEIPKKVALLKGRTDISYIPDNVVLNNIFTIGWYHKIKRHYPMRCQHRGYFTYGPATIRTGDIFGFFVRQIEVPALDHLTVYPRVVPLPKLLLPSNNPMGDINVKHHLFQDPVLTKGIREYVYGDSLKRLHWKSTARHGKLLTRLYESTTTVEMAIFLDIRTVDAPYWGSVPEKLELAIITAVALANDALSRGYRVGLYVNQYKHGTASLIRIPSSQKPTQFRQILETLAPLQELEALPMSRFLNNESRNLPWGNSIVLVSAVPNEELITTLYKMNRAGRRIAFFQIGGESPAYLGKGIPVYHVSEQTPWQETESIEFN